MLRTHIIIFTMIVLCVGVAFNGEGMDGNEGDQKMKTLRPCPSSPNCIASHSGDPQHRMDPIPFTRPREMAQARLRKVLQAMPRSEITKEEPGYIAVSFCSRIFGFVDESEFAFDEESGLVHFRSGARTGYYDFGVNRSRMRQIAETFRAAD